MIERHNYAGTRLRNPDKLRANLHYQLAVSEADNNGFNFPSTTTADLQESLSALTDIDAADGVNLPSTTTADLQEALTALTRNDEEEEVEEEVMGWDWEELDEYYTETW